MKIKYTTTPQTPFESLKSIFKSWGYVYCEESDCAVGYMREPYEVWSIDKLGKTRFCISPVRLAYDYENQGGTIYLTEGREKVLAFLKKGIDENKLPGS